MGRAAARAWRRERGADSVRGGDVADARGTARRQDAGRRRRDATGERARGADKGAAAPAAAVGSDSMPAAPARDTEPSPGGKGPGAGQSAFYDRLDDFKQFRREQGLGGDDRLSQAEAARAYVMRRQADTNAQHFVAYDANSNAVTHAGTSLEKFESAGPPDLEAMERDLNVKMTRHHSHPNDAGLSDDDVASLPREGMEWVAAHGKGDELSAARLTPAAKSALRFGDEVGQMRAKKLLRGLWNDTYDAFSLPMNRAVARGELTRDAETRISTEIVNRALGDAGIMEYVTTRTIPSTPFIDELRALANAHVRDIIRSKLPVLANHVPDSQTEPMGLGQGMARISGQDVGASPGQPGRRRGGRNSAGRAGPAQRQGDLGRDQGSKTSEIRRAGAHLAAIADRDRQEQAREGEKEVVPPPRVTGHELEVVPTSYGHLIMMTARYARAHLDGRSVVNRETHAPIALTWQRGLDQIAAPGKPVEILLAVPAIPEMLAGARYLGSAPDPQHRADVARVHGFASAVDVCGRRLDVPMIVRQNRQGRLVLDRMEPYAAAGVCAA
jgi:hypothetical protein